MSHRIAAKITGIAGYVPPKVLTNADLEKMVETNDEWIRTRTGIRERHVTENGVASSDLATAARWHVPCNASCASPETANASSGHLLA